MHLVSIESRRPASSTFLTPAASLFRDAEGDKAFPFRLPSAAAEHLCCHHSHAQKLRGGGGGCISHDAQYSVLTHYCTVMYSVLSCPWPLSPTIRLVAKRMTVQDSIIVILALGTSLPNSSQPPVFPIFRFHPPSIHPSHTCS
jgi:hypothetical protein